MRIRVLLAILFLISACGREAFMSNTSVDVNFSEYETYAFLSGASSSGFDDDIIRFRSIQKAKLELDARGFEMDVDSPDFYVVVHTFFSATDDPTTNPDFRSPLEDPGVRFYFQGEAPSLARPSEGIPNIAYAPGTIAIEVIDAVDNSLLWNAWSEQLIRQSLLPEDLEDYIGRLFENFPVDLQ